MANVLGEKSISDSKTEVLWTMGDSFLRPVPTRFLIGLCIHKYSLLVTFYRTFLFNYYYSVCFLSPDVVLKKGYDCVDCKNNWVCVAFFLSELKFRRS
jgi:hypothetical protein